MHMVNPCVVVLSAHELRGGYVYANPESMAYEPGPEPALLHGFREYPVADFVDEADLFRHPG